MKFEEVLLALKEGKKIRIKEWKEIQYIYKPKNENDLRAEDYKAVNLSWKDFFSDNWEVVKEKKKVKLRDLTEEQFKKYCKSFTRNNNYGNDCDKCVFHNVSCIYWYENCWIKHKDLYSDKFLNQEIEIED